MVEGVSSFSRRWCIYKRLGKDGGWMAVLLQMVAPLQAPLEERQGSKDKPKEYRPFPDDSAFASVWGK